MTFEKRVSYPEGKGKVNQTCGISLSILHVTSSDLPSTVCIPFLGFGLRLYAASEYAQAI